MCCEYCVCCDGLFVESTGEDTAIVPCDVCGEHVSVGPADEPTCRRCKEWQDDIEIETVLNFLGNGRG